MKNTLLYLFGAGFAITSMNSHGAGNELFETKTATQSLHESSSRILSSTDPKSRAVIRKAQHANRKALKAYLKCPSRPEKARKQLHGTTRVLDGYERKLEGVDSIDTSGLADFSQELSDRVESLSYEEVVCDNGETIIQPELSYNIDPAPFVNFAQTWGDMGFGAHGTFADFAEGSAAPDHVHSHTYYGVVISGTIKNPFGSEPNNAVTSAKALPAGSFWSVPGNAIHTTACESGSNCLFYFHSRKNFDFDVDTTDGDANGENSQEISVDEIRANLEPISPFAKMYTVWGDRAAGAHGTFGEFLPGGISPEHTHSYSYHGVVISGTMVNPFENETVNDAQPLEAGDYWFVPAGVDHVTACVSAEPCLFYFHSEGAFDFITPE